MTTNLDRATGSPSLAPRRTSSVDGAGERLNLGANQRSRSPEPYEKARRVPVALPRSGNGARTPAPLHTRRAPFSSQASIQNEGTRQSKGDMPQSFDKSGARASSPVGVRAFRSSCGTCAGCAHG